MVPTLSISTEELIFGKVLTKEDDGEILSSLPDLETFLNPSVIGSVMGTIVAVNSQTVSLFGYENKEELLDKPISMLMPEPFKSEHDSYLFRYEKKRGTVSSFGHKRQLQGLTKDGTVFPVDIVLAQLETRQYFLCNFYFV